MEITVSVVWLRTTRGGSIRDVSDHASPRAIRINLANGSSAVYIFVVIITIVNLCCMRAIYAIVH